MYIGRYYHHLETKGRLSLPKAFRITTQDWVITRGLDGGLFLFESMTFAQELEQLATQPFTKQAARSYIRLMANDAMPVSPDQLGRITLPAHLIELAKLTNEVVVVGSYSRIEIWDRATYHQYLDSIEPQAEAIAETLYDS